MSQKLHDFEVHSGNHTTINRGVFGYFATGQEISHKSIRLLGSSPVQYI
ncbi:MAG: hypothetical protein ACE5DY_01895 [Mariprofundaceae bacterium]